MRRLVIFTVAVAALTSAAMAQQPPAAPPVSPPTASDMTLPSPPTGLDAPRPGDRAGPPPRDPDGDVAFHGHRPPPPPPSKAAHFRIEDGDTKIDIKCADDEPMKACSDILLTVIDRLEGQVQR